MSNYYARFYNYTLNVNGVKHMHGNNYETDYLPDIITNMFPDLITKLVILLFESCDFSCQTIDRKFVR